METRANFVLIGIFTIAGVLAGLGFFIWLARAEFDRQYAYYDILFESVSGLGTSAEVLFNGLNVGQVLELALYEDDPALIRVRIEVDAATPVGPGTVAQLQAQGVTGVSAVALQGAETEREEFTRFSPDGVPIIESEKSVLQTLTEDAPDLVEEVSGLLADLRAFVRPENQDYVTRILNSLENAAGQLDDALSDFSAISQSVREGTGEIAAFTGRLDQIGAAIESTLATADETLRVVQSTMAEAETTLQAGTEALTAAGDTFGAADQTLAQARTFLAEDLPRISADLSRAIGTLEGAVAEVRSEVVATVGGFGQTATAATARLAEIEGTIAAFDATLAEAQETLSAIESASASVGTLVEGEGTALVADARATLAAVNETVASLNRIAAEDVPVIVADIRAATATANEVIDSVGRDVAAFTERLDPLVATGEETLATATQALRDASATLGRIEGALDTAERTLAAAGTTFEGANALIETDLGPAIGDIRSAAAQFEQTMAQVTEDVPAITQGLREAVARATETVATVEAAVAASAPGIESFTTTGLAEFTRFAREAQDLIARLDRLTQQIERDPTRFFFGGNPSEFRR